ncbi:MAG: acyl-CoA dehydratase activase, partial [Burkholderiales bacterium]|nr:acyl-CoA dehydratase activase [Burkholderiales bacterium]
MTILSLGLDLGSTTAKYAVVDANGSILESEYKRHGSDARNTALSLLQGLQNKYPKALFKLMLTGSAALDLASGTEANFVQEVIASSKAVRKYYPDTDVAIDLGGEDAKVLYLTNGIEMRMNEVCAGGTGAFLDQMATLLETDTAGLDQLAKNAKTLYPIASRCGVFAKSDVVSFLNAGAKREDIAASILQAIVDQTIGGLSCGRPIQGKVAFIGGPLHFLKQLKAHFIKSLNLAEELVANIPQGQFAVAVGAALYALEGHAKNAKSYLPLPLSEWIRQIKARPPAPTSSKKLQPLFLNKEEYEAFLKAHNQQITPRASLEDATGDLWLGIDLGSTTVKGVLLDDQLRLLDFWYGSNSGTPREVLVPYVVKLLRKIPSSARIKGICTTGYGSDLAAAILGASLSEVETIAHLKAAIYLNPQVHYVIDIGGQDMKCLKTSNGLIEQIKLNEACSSGCGAFIQTFAKSLNLTITEFVQKALFAKNPVDLGTRCTVFMNSRVKQAQKEGASIDDIAAGLCYSVIRNALYKVMRLDPTELIGKEIVVQGGAFLNTALLRVLELYLGKQVLRPDISGLMGAFGCALIAKEKVQRNHLEAPQISAEALEALRVTTRSFNCKGCSNRC